MNRSDTLASDLFTFEHRTNFRTLGLVALFGFVLVYSITVAYAIFIVVTTLLGIITDVEVGETWASLHLIVVGVVGTALFFYSPPKRFFATFINLPVREVARDLLLSTIICAVQQFVLWTVFFLTKLHSRDIVIEITPLLRTLENSVLFGIVFIPNLYRVARVYLSKVPAITLIFALSYWQMPKDGFSIIAAFDLLVVVIFYCLYFEKKGNCLVPFLHNFLLNLVLWDATRVVAIWCT